MKIIAANWKMNKTREDAHRFFGELAEKMKLQHRGQISNDKNVIICVPFTAIGIAREYADELGFTVGAQNFHPAKNGAYTGEISAEMLCEIGTRAVLVGHSERRTLFGETDDFVAQKVTGALTNGLTPILCVGEKDGEKLEAVLSKQLKSYQKGAIIAYEPVWAIGTGKVATIAQIEQAHALIKKLVAESNAGGLNPPEPPAVLYGGSVNEKNAAEILAAKNVDGVLVGGASLDADKFMTIITCV